MPFKRLIKRLDGLTRLYIRQNKVAEQFEEAKKLGVDVNTMEQNGVSLKKAKKRVLK